MQTNCGSAAQATRVARTIPTHAILVNPLVIELPSPGGAARSARPPHAAGASLLGPSGARNGHGSRDSSSPICRRSPARSVFQQRAGADRVAEQPHLESILAQAVRAVAPL